MLDTAKSPAAILHGVTVSATTLTDGFWSARRKVNVEVRLPSLLELFESNGIIDNFRRVSGRKDVPRRGRSTRIPMCKWLGVRIPPAPPIFETSSLIITSAEADTGRSGQPN